MARLLYIAIYTVHTVPLRFTKILVWSVKYNRSIRPCMQPSWNPFSCRNGDILHKNILQHPSLKEASANLCIASDWILPSLKCHGWKMFFHLQHGRFLQKGCKCLDFKGLDSHWHITMFLQIRPCKIANCIDPRLYFVNPLKDATCCFLWKRSPVFVWRHRFQKKDSFEHCTFNGCNLLSSRRTKARVNSTSKAFKETIFLQRMQ